MSWLVTLPEPLGDAGAGHASRVARDSLSFSAGLGSSRASAQWSWVEPSAPRPRNRNERLTLRPVEPRPIPIRQDVAATVVRIPAEIVRAMSLVARNSGRSERELWAEAAREWLYSRSHGDDPPPATPAAMPVASRSWDEIDGLLARLREPMTASKDPAA